MPFDRLAGQELDDRDALRDAIDACSVVIHLAAMHPLVAPADATRDSYWRANVEPFAVLLDVVRRAGVRRVVLASSTSVWRDAPPGAPARFIDDATPADDDSPYAASKRECERLLAASGAEGVVARLARFARAGNDEDEVRKLYRAIDPRDAAALIVAAADRAPAGAVYAVSAPTPFRPEDAPELARDARHVVLMRTGHRPPWCPAAIGSVVVGRRAEREVRWQAAHPSRFLSGATVTKTPSPQP